MGVAVTDIIRGDVEATGIEAAWEGGSIVFIVARRGLVACGIADLSVAEKFGFAVAVCRGTPERPLKTAGDLLSADVAAVSPGAAELGIRPGMPARAALERLS
ncbi:MAG: DUF1805 domain-containing protein [Spirochaetes bacterium]|nr:DUF1805 domain-containing protein [Spirochaetota bacterium]